MRVGKEEFPVATLVVTPPKRNPVEVIRPWIKGLNGRNTPRRNSNRCCP